jgi:hypothetical protein
MPLSAACRRRTRSPCCSVCIPETIRI